MLKKNPKLRTFWQIMAKLNVIYFKLKSVLETTDNSPSQQNRAVGLEASAKLSGGKKHAESPSSCEQRASQDNWVFFFFLEIMEISGETKNTLFLFCFFL